MNDSGNKPHKLLLFSSQTWYLIVLPGGKLDPTPELVGLLSP